MKRAIALSGGGTKGAYELGVWKALLQLDVDYQIVTGTSIGSINGALMAMHAYEQCVKMWENLVMEDMMSDGIEVTSKIEDFYNQKKALKPFLKKYFKNKGADISPFAELVARMVDERAVRESSVDYGLVTVQVPSMNPFMLSKKEIPDGLLSDYILASSAIFPVFPLHKIGEETYIDGCYYDNLPIDLAISMGATDIVAVDLHTTPAHPNYAKRPYVKYIKPSRELGGILDFDHDRILANAKMGYQDALKAYGELKGFLYSFTPKSVSKMKKQVERLSVSMAMGESILMRNNQNRIAKAGDIYRMFHELEEHTDGKTLTKEDYFVRAAEICGEIFEMDVTQVYDLCEFARSMREKIDTPEAYPDAALFAQSAKRNLFAKLSDLKLQNNSRYITGCLYYAMQNEAIDYEEQLGILTYLPHEVAAALFLHAL